ncbi:hypothetical protein RND81_02G241800 [Saponaria officinalis]|uniref:F-box protein n=1 Tax=Saponaria officinalis TaxID=3572 RepID=A0AAW1MNR7_SAPOF
MDQANKILFLNGKFHWCGTNCIAAYDPFNKPLHCDIIPLPAMDPLKSENNIGFTLEVSEGRLRLVKVSFPQRFVVWDLVDYANKVWVRKFDFHSDLIFQSLVGVAARDKAYMSASSTLMLFDVTNKSTQLVYEPITLDNVSILKWVQPFFSSPWPTPVAVRHNKLLSYVNFS